VAVSVVAVTQLNSVVVAGNDYTIGVTLTKDGAAWNLTGATVTSTIKSTIDPAFKIENHVVTLVTPTSGVCALILTDTETATLQIPATSHPRQAIIHVGDFKVVESDGSIIHAGMFTFEVRRAIT
jgi:hypothetical protein